MSKKKKFKKFSKAQILQEIQRDASTVSQPVIEKNQAPRKFSATSITSTVASNEKISPSSGPIGAEARYVRADLKKIAVVFSIILLLLVGIIYVDKKTTVLTDFTDNLVKNLNINQ